MDIINPLDEENKFSSPRTTNRSKKSGHTPLTDKKRNESTQCRQGGSDCWLAASLLALELNDKNYRQENGQEPYLTTKVISPRQYLMGKGGDTIAGYFVRLKTPPTAIANYSKSGSAQVQICFMHDNKLKDEDGKSRSLSSWIKPNSTAGRAKRNEGVHQFAQVIQNAVATLLRGNEPSKSHVVALKGRNLAPGSGPGEAFLTLVPTLDAKDIILVPFRKRDDKGKLKNNLKVVDRIINNRNDKNVVVLALRGTQEDGSAWNHLVVAKKSVYKTKPEEGSEELVITVGDPHTPLQDSIFHVKFTRPQKLYNYYQAQPHGRKPKKRKVTFGLNTEIRYFKESKLDDVKETDWYMVGKAWESALEVLDEKESPHTCLSTNNPKVNKNVSLVGNKFRESLRQIYSKDSSDFKREQIARKEARREARRKTQEFRKVVFEDNERRQGATTRSMAARLAGVTQ